MITKQPSEFIKQIENITEPFEQWQTECYMGNKYCTIQIGRLYIKKIILKNNTITITNDSNRIYKLKILEDTIFKITKNK